MLCAITPETSVNGLAHCETSNCPAISVEGLDEDSFDVVIANPPYYANSSIARLFIERGRALLKPDGRFYVVTKQVEEVADVMMEIFENVEAIMHRGYTILSNSD